MINNLRVGLIKKIFLYEMSYFPEPYPLSKSKSNVELDFPNYATKADFKSATCIDVLELAKKTDLASLTSDVDKLDTDKLERTPIDLTNLGNVIKMMLLKGLYIMN